MGISTFLRVRPEIQIYGLFSESFRNSFLVCRMEVHISVIGSCQFVSVFACFLMRFSLGSP